MTKPLRLQLSRAAGFKLQVHSKSVNGLVAVRVDRATRFGNPYRVGEIVDAKQVKRWGWRFSPSGLGVTCDTVKDAVGRFAHALRYDEAIQDWLRQQLAGKNLACWCSADSLCHADVLLAVVNTPMVAIAAMNRRTDEQILLESEALLATAGKP